MKQSWFWSACAGALIGGMIQHFAAAVVPAASAQAMKPLTPRYQRRCMEKQEDELEEVLNSTGQERWELVMSSRSSHNTHFLCLRRAKPER